MRVARLLLACAALALCLLSASAKLPRASASAVAPSRRAAPAQKRAVKPVQRRVVDALSGDSDGYDDDGDDDDVDGRGGISGRVAWSERRTTRKIKPQPKLKSQKQPLKQKTGGAPAPSTLRKLAAWSPQRMSRDQPGVGQKVASVLSTVMTKSREFARVAKAHLSSSHEQALLAATWPDDAPVTEEQKQEVLSKVKGVADLLDDYAPKDDPYRTTLHKLWMKMCEKDWRTTVKALHLLHYIVRTTPRDDSNQLKQTFEQMSTEINPKSAPLRYFNLPQVENLDSNGKPYHAFVKSYATLVFDRTEYFNSKFDELRDIDASTPARKAVRLLRFAVNVAQRAVSCTLPTKDIRNHITFHAVADVATELHTLWQLVCNALATLIQAGSLNHPTKETISLLEQFLATRPKVQAYLADTKSYLPRKYSTSVLVDVPEEPSVNIVERHLSELRRAQPASAQQEAAEEDEEVLDEEDAEAAYDEDLDEEAEDDDRAEVEAAPEESDEDSDFFEGDEEGGEGRAVDDAEEQEEQEEQEFADDGADDEDEADDDE